MDSRVMIQYNWSITKWYIPLNPFVRGVIVVAKTVFKQSIPY